MAKATVNVGTTGNDGTGDPIRTAFQSLNANHTELYSLLGNGTTLSVTGDVAISSGSATIQAGSVENSMLAGSIADTKLNTISTAGKVDLAALEIDGGTDIGADLTTSDLIIVDDGAGGTNRKAALSRLITLVDANAGFATKGFATAMAIAL